MAASLQIAPDPQRRTGQPAADRLAGNKTPPEAALICHEERVDLRFPSRERVKAEPTTGSPAGSRSFKPDDPVTRAEVATFLARFAERL